MPPSSRVRERIARRKSLRSRGCAVGNPAEGFTRGPGRLLEQFEADVGSVEGVELPGERHALIFLSGEPPVEG